MNIQSIKDRVTRELESETCPVHGKHPQIVWNGESIRATCCCDDFRTYIGEKAADVYTNALADELLDPLRHI